MIVKCKVVRTDRKKPHRSPVKTSGYQKKFTKVSMNIVSLKEDLRVIKTPFLIKYAEHVLLSFEADLRQLMGKDRDSSSPVVKKPLDSEVTYRVN